MGVFKNIFGKLAHVEIIEIIFDLHENRNWLFRIEKTLRQQEKINKKVVGEDDCRIIIDIINQSACFGACVLIGPGWSQSNMRNAQEKKQPLESGHPR